MAITRNAGSLFLSAASPRLLTAANAAIVLTASTSVFHVSAGGTPQVASITFNSQLILLDGIVSYSCVGGTLSSVAGNAATLLFTDMSAATATITSSLVYRGVTFSSVLAVTKVQDSAGPAGPTGPSGSPGATGSSTGTVNLYQWATVTPASPTGTATFTWASGATTAYTDADGWAITVPTNPGSPSIKLYVCSKPVTAAAGTTTSSVTFASGASIAAYSQNGATGSQGIPGTKTATAFAYQWGLSSPTTTGTAVYTWATGLYDNAPTTGWTKTKGTAPGAGYTLYEASVRLVDSTGATTISVDWTTSAIAGISYIGTSGGAGSQGASAKRAYVLVDGNSLNVTPTTVTMTGTALPTTGSWGETRAWQATPPVPVAGQSVFQADGVFDPVPNQTVWNVPYLSNLKVGNLSAISANFGAMTAGTIDLGTDTSSWHVDNGGNMWAGASTYAAAPFKVSSAGAAVFSNITITNGSSTVIDGSGLKAGFEAPGTKNSEVAKGLFINTDPNFIRSDLWTVQTNAGAAPINFSFVTSAPGASAPTCVYPNNSSGTGNAEIWLLENTLYPIDSTKTYELGANLYADAGNGRSAYVGICFYQSDGTFIPNSGWGGTWSGYSVVNQVPAAGTFTRYSGDIGVGTAKTIPTNATQCRIGVIINYGTTGAGGLRQAAQGVKLIDVTQTRAAATTAQWSNIAGQTNAPANNATVGAPAGTNVGSTSSTTVESWANSGQVAYNSVTDATTGLAQRLRSNAANILAGGAGITVGSLTYNTSGIRTGGYGVAITSFGIIGYNSSGIGTISIDASTGSVAVSGDISGSTGTFYGNLSAVGGTFAGNLSAAGGTFSGALSGATGTFSGALSAASGSFTGSLSGASGSFSGTLTASQVITTDNLVNNAATIPVSAYTAGELDIAVSNSDTTTVVQSAQITSTGAPITIIASAVVSTDDSHGANLQIYRDGTMIYSTTSLLSVSGNVPLPFCASISDTPGAGSHWYYFKVVALSDGGTSGYTRVSNRSISLLETKR